LVNLSGEVHSQTVILTRRHCPVMTSNVSSNGKALLGRLWGQHQL
jgi:hypothetical protein